MVTDLPLAQPVPGRKGFVARRAVGRGPAQLWASWKTCERENLPCHGQSSEEHTENQGIWREERASQTQITSWQNTYIPKLAILSILSVQFRDIKYICSGVQALLRFPNPFHLSKEKFCSH